MPESSRPHESTIRDYVRLLLRRKWIVIAMVVLLPTLAVVFAYRQQSLYTASSKVLLKEGNLAATISGIQDTSVYLDPTRVAQTQIELAETPRIAGRVLKAAHVKGISPGALLGSTSITAEPNADILDFSVTNHDPNLAVKLANTYAIQYTIYRRQLDTASLTQALTDLNNRIDQLQADGKTTLANELTAKAEQLRTFQAVENSNAVLARAADGAAQIQPTPSKYGLVGLALGVILGIGLAFVWDALDTRVRSAEEIATRLGIPLLARLPEPPRQLQKDDELVMIEEPSGVEGELFRVLRTNVDFANLERNAKSIMITSALEKEGKSTTISNLAVAAARAGRSVVLVDLDLRRPKLDKFFKLEGRPGLTNAVLGHTSLEESTARVAIPGAKKDPGAAEGNGHAELAGFLDVIPTGPPPPDAGEFVGTKAVAKLLDELTKRYDVVFIDAPPILHVGDALTLASKVDALLIVSRLPNIRRPVLKELKRVLESCPAPRLGFVLAGAGQEEGYGYGYGYYGYYAQQRPRSVGSRERVT